DESQRLNEVLTRFLSFARPRELKAAAFAIEPEIRTVIELARTQKETARARIEVMDHPCPDGSGSGNGPARADDSNAGTAAVTENPLLAFGDREQIRQVLLNLILNAAQAAGPGGHVEVRCSAEEDRIRLEIRDDGPGFSDEAIENVFTPFFTTKEKGTGLGLAISHRIVESHGGCIEVANRPEGGACVTLELPRPDRPARNEGAHHG
ncbi:MAG: ATP-binding protein, partial [Candidatus Eisenbacteria bacterium]|nr:ATP-binding protein [Candidatus Eisenbacteria bacterium]